MTWSSASITAVSKTLYEYLECYGVAKDEKLMDLHDIFICVSLRAP